MIKNLFEKLLMRRSHVGRWVYLFAALPLLFFTLWGWDYGAYLTFFPLAALCLIQFSYPTLFVWLILFSIYLAGTAVYVYVYFRDLYQLLLGKSSGDSVFVDGNDATVFTILVVLITALAVGLYKIKPKDRNITSGSATIGASL